MITLEQAKNLKRGDILHHISHKNSDGTPVRWKVNGKVKTWKRDPSRMEVPVKHGIYDYDTLSDCDLHLVSLPT